MFQVLARSGPEAPQPLLCGWVHKRSPCLGAGWQKRFLCLLEQDGALAYWRRRPQYASEEPIGSINLVSVRSIEVVGGTILIVRTLGRDFQFSFDSARLKDFWLDRLIVSAASARRRLSLYASETLTARFSDWADNALSSGTWRSLPFLSTLRKAHRFARADQFSPSEFSRSVFQRLGIDEALEYAAIGAYLLPCPLRVCIPNICDCSTVAGKSFARRFLAAVFALWNAPPDVLPFFAGSDDHQEHSYSQRRASNGSFEEILARQVIYNADKCQFKICKRCTRFNQLEKRKEVKRRRFSADIAELRRSKRARLKLVQSSRPLFLLPTADSCASATQNDSSLKEERTWGAHMARRALQELLLDSPEKHFERVVNGSLGDFTFALGLCEAADSVVRQLPLFGSPGSIPHLSQYLWRQLFPHQTEHLSQKSSDNDTLCIPFDSSPQEDSSIINLLMSSVCVNPSLNEKQKCDGSCSLLLERKEGHSILVEFAESLTYARFERALETKTGKSSSSEDAVFIRTVFAPLHLQAPLLSIQKLVKQNIMVGTFFVRFSSSLGPVRGDMANRRKTRLQGSSVWRPRRTLSRATTSATLSEKKQSQTTPMFTAPKRSGSYAGNFLAVLLSSVPIASGACLEIHRETIDRELFAAWMKANGAAAKTWPGRVQASDLFSKLDRVVLLPTSIAKRFLNTGADTLDSALHYQDYQLELEDFELIDCAHCVAMTPVSCHVFVECGF